MEWLANALNNGSPISFEAGVLSAVFALAASFAVSETLAGAERKVAVSRNIEAAADANCVSAT